MRSLTVGRCLVHRNLQFARSNSILPAGGQLVGPLATAYQDSLRQGRLPGRGSSMSTAAAQIKFAAGADESALTQTLQQQLLASAGGRWALISSGAGLERSFKFKTFAKTWDFMTAVSLQCKLKNHHPEWANVYNTTHIRWTTHNPSGLSAKDVELAVICDQLATDFGELVQHDGDEGSCELKSLADTVASTAGDCCTPKKK